MHDFWVFVFAGILLNITPGSDMALIVIKSSKEGLRSGIAASLGIGAGSLIHILFAAIGLSAILMASAIGFNLLKWVGAIYLFILGLHMLLRPSKMRSKKAMQARRVTSFKRSFYQGFLTNLLNPKVAIFFLAFLPQFIEPAYNHKAIPFLILGLTFNLTGTLWNLTISFVTSRSLQEKHFMKLKSNMSKVVGGMFIALSVKLAFTKLP